MKIVNQGTLKKLAQTLLTVAPIAMFGLGSGIIFGEPVIPEHLKKQHSK